MMAGMGIAGTAGAVETAVEVLTGRSFAIEHYEESEAVMEDIIDDLTSRIISKNYLIMWKHKNQCYGNWMKQNQPMKNRTTKIMNRAFYYCNFLH